MIGAIRRLGSFHGVVSSLATVRMPPSADLPRASHGGFQWSRTGMPSTSRERRNVTVGRFPLKFHRWNGSGFERPKYRPTLRKSRTP
jgi:hypothetical protein